MRQANGLAVSRMSDRQLWSRLRQRHAQLSVYGLVDLKSSEVRAIAAECVAIARELQMRGTQLELVPPDASSTAGSR